MTAHVTDTDRGLQSVAARLIGKARVHVGILTDASGQVHTAQKQLHGATRAAHHARVARDGGSLDPRATESTTQAASLIEIAAANEFGVPGHIPQRSFIRGTVDSRIDEIHGVQAALAKQIVLGSVTAVVAMQRLGAKIQGMIQQQISRHIAPENAPSTIARKGSSTPLVDTGQLRSSISFLVEVQP